MQTPLELLVALIFSSFVLVRYAFSFSNQVSSSDNGKYVVCLLSVRQLASSSEVLVVIFVSPLPAKTSSSMEVAGQLI